MKVFISWSGDRSKALALALRDWLPLVLHYVEPWLSEADIAAGDRWADAVAKELEASNFGIVCVTRENVGSQWVLFEAGALAKSIQASRVIPLLLDLEYRDITGPLAQFQAKKVDESGLNEVISSINSASNHTVPEPQARKLFDALWLELETAVGTIPPAETEAKPIRPQTEILEELVASVRTLDSRFREMIEETPRRIRSQRSRYHPMMFRDLARFVAEKPGDPISFLIIASAFREEMPWLYELAVDAYRAAKDGRPDEADQAMRRFQRATEILERGPFPLEEFGFDSRLFRTLFRDLRRVALRDPLSDEDPKKRPRRMPSDSIDEQE